MAKINIESVEIESSGTLSEESFGIGNIGFILSLLRSKIYSNIKRAICREYSCNARDAHREVGTPDVPVEITLPTYLDPNYRVRDFGPGISPDRIKNIFILYGNSTKRDSNEATGCWGIGAKSSFGYTDSFIVNTFIDGIHRSYNAIIDDSRCGKLVLLSETPTKEKTGTEIVVPVQKQDFQYFNFETHQVTKHWDVKPIIKGGTIVYEDMKSINYPLAGTNWFIGKSTHGNRDVFVVVDGIEYSFDINCLDERVIQNFSYGTSLYLKFNTGEIPISANREQIEIDEVAKKAVTRQLKIVKSEIEKKFSDTIAGASSFIEANLLLDKISGMLNWHDTVETTWNGIKLFGKGINLSSAECIVYAANLDRTASKRGTYASHTLPISNDVAYCVMDCAMPFDSRVIKAASKILKDFPKASSVAMIKLHNNDKKEVTEKRLDLLNLLKFEDYHSEAKSRKASLGRLTFFVFKSVSYGDSLFQRSSYDKFEEDPNKKIWISLRKKVNAYNVKQAAYPLYKGKELSFSELHSYYEKNMKGYSVYGFYDTTPQDRLEEAVEGIKSFEDFVAKDMKTNNISLEEVKYSIAQENESSLFGEEEETEMLSSSTSFKNTNSPMLEYLQKSYSYFSKRNLLSSYSIFLTTGIKPSPFGFDAETIMEDLRTRYPLLKYLAKKSSKTYYRARDATASVEDIIEYVNQIDQIEEFKKSP